MLHSICQQIWKTQQWPQDGRKSAFVPIPKKGNAKECSNYSTIAFISHASKVLLKILQGTLQQFMNSEPPDVQAGFRKGRETRDQIDNIRWIIEKPRGFQENINFCLIDCAKAVDCVDHNKLENSDIWEHQTIWPASWETHMHVRKQQLEMDMVPNRERRTSRLYIVTLLIQLTWRVHHEKHRAGLSTSWNQDCWEKYQEPQICRWHHPYGTLMKNVKASWWKWKRRVKKLA